MHAARSAAVIAAHHGLDQIGKPLLPHLSTHHVFIVCEAMGTHTTGGASGSTICAV